MPRDRARPDDLVTGLCRRLHRDLGWPRDQVVMLELQLRAEFGGRKWYVKRAPLRIVVERERVHRS